MGNACGSYVPIVSKRRSSDSDRKIFLGVLTVEMATAGVA